jgi:putative ABC transport system permease protein
MTLRPGTLLQDLRYALRRWVRRPGFVLAAVLTLALGIGATTALFSIIDAVVLRPLPYPDPDRLVMVYSVRPERRSDQAFAATWDRGRISRPMFDELRTSPSLRTIGVWIPQSMTFGNERTEIVPTLHVSSTYIPTLGAPILHGRNFDEQDDETNTDSVILSYETWQRRFGGREDVVGERIVLGYASSGGQSTHTVIGVVGPGVVYPGAAPEFLRPIGYMADTNRKYPTLAFRSVARLAAGASYEAAESQAAAMASGLPHTEPTSVRLVPLAQEQLGDAGRPLWLLFAGAGFLLLIACSNVAGLLLGEGRVRRQELAIRAAIGGSRARILQQLTVEHLVLACAGSIAGVLLAVWFTQLLVAAAPARLPRLDTVAVDLRAIGFGLGLGFSTLLLFGLLPAFALSRTRATEALAIAGRTAGSRRHLGHRFAVAAQMALALVLLVGASLLGETMLRLAGQPLGFDPQNLVVVTTTFTGPPTPPGAIRTREDRMNINQIMNAAATARTGSVLERLTPLPGVAAAAGAGAMPFSGILRDTIEITLEGQPDSERHRVARQSVTEGYFDTMRMPIVDGRGFGPSDQYGSHAAVVSEAFARQFFAGDALGRRFSHRWGEQPANVSRYEVVGIVPDVKHRSFADEDATIFYHLDRQGGRATHFVVRMAGDAAAMVPSIRRAIHELDPQMVVTDTKTMEQTLAASIDEERFRAAMSVLFGAAALVLAAVGLYGLATRRVAERRHEIGVRVAMGATPGDVRSLVFRDGLAIVFMGLLVGLPGAYAASQATQAFLFGVAPTAPHVFGLAVAVLATTALIAMLLPALRASRTDPSVVLRE